MPDDQARRTARKVDDPIRAVRHWLRETCRGAVRALTGAEIARYAAQAIRRGWEVNVTIDGTEHRLLVLIPTGFPYARPRVALTEDRLLVWPHIEELGLMCLEARPVASTQPVEMVRAALADACAFIEQCTGGDTNDGEFRREFLSYWNRFVSDRAHPVRSLLSPGGAARRIAVWRGKAYDLVADTPIDIERWLAHMGFDPPPRGWTTYDGLLVRLADAPTPRDFPKTVGGLETWLNRDAPGSVDELAELTDTQKRILLVLEAAPEEMGRQDPSNVGLMAVDLHGPLKLKVNGFRDGKVPVALRRATWLSKATVSTHKVGRVDAAWVHGRGRDPDHPALFAKTACIIGCGALGSHVTMRLAQAGVGALLLVDPQTVEAANVGRHALGIRAMGLGKAASLASLVAGRFPHMRSVRPIPRSWEGLTDEERDQIARCDLLVSAVGDWAVEGPINEWHRRRADARPIIFAWLEEHGSAAHALAIIGLRGCLHCLVNGDGSAIEHETSWPDGSMLLSEPACGTTFQPFGPVELGYSEALVADLCLDTLLGRTQTTTHRVYATSPKRLTLLGGSWTGTHAEIRPAGFDAPLFTERAFVARSNCPVCSRR